MADPLRSAAPESRYTEDRRGDGAYPGHGCIGLLGAGRLRGELRRDSRVSHRRCGRPRPHPRPLGGDLPALPRRPPAARSTSRYGRSAPTNADDLTYAIGSDWLDLEPIVHDACILELPLAPLCRDDCQGLCPVCGANRNSETCSCEAPVDPRWSALAVLRPENDESETSALHRSGPDGLDDNAMAVPKKKTSKSKSRSRRASAWSLTAPRQQLPAVPAGEAAPRGLPQLRLVPGPAGHRGQLTSDVAALRLPSPSTPWVATGRRVRSSPGPAEAAEEGIPVVLVGPDDGSLGDMGDLAIIAAERGHRDGRGRRQGGTNRRRTRRSSGRPRPCETAGPRPWSAPETPEPRWRVPSCAWAASRALPARHRDAAPDPGRHPDRPRGRRSQRRVPPEWLVQFAEMGAAFFVERYNESGPLGGVALDRRGGLQGEQPRQRGPRRRPHGIAGVRVHRQRRRPGPVAGGRRRHRHRWLHRKRGTQDPRGSIGVLMGSRPGVQASPETKAASEVLLPELCRCGPVDPEGTGGACCSVSTASASSATARPRPERSSNAIRVGHETWRSAIRGREAAAAVRPLG